MIKRITIENFKSIKKIEIEVPRFAIMVGNNGAGKTNIFKAIKLTALLASGNQIQYCLDRLQLLPKELLFDQTNNKMKFTFELILNERPIKYSFEITQEIIENKYIYRISQEFLSNGNQDQPILQRTGDRIDIYPQQGEGSVVELANTQLAVSLLRKPDMIALVQQFLSNILVDHLDPLSLREFGSLSKVGSESEKNLAENLYSLINNNQNKYKEIESEAKNMISGLDSINIGKTDQEGRLVVVFKESDFPYDLTFFSASDGNLRTLGILSSILGDPKPNVVFIDEIENSMHPTRIKSIVKLLDYLSEREKSSIQTLLTSHSPVVLNYVNDQNIMYVYKKNGETKIATKPINNKKVLQYLEMYEKEGYTLGDLFDQGILEKIFTSQNEDLHASGN